MTRRFTGWHMLAVMIGFFGVIIAVNVTMATYASTTFGGLVVNNSYVANQQFNGWLAAAHSQDRLGWSADAAIIDRRAVVRLAGAGKPLAGAQVTALVEHPLGVVPDVALRFHEAEPGRYVAQSRLPAGRWRLRLAVTRGAEHADFVKEVAE